MEKEFLEQRIKLGVSLDEMVILWIFSINPYATTKEVSKLTGIEEQNCGRKVRILKKEGKVKSVREGRSWKKTVMVEMKKAAGRAAE